MQSSSHAQPRTGRSAGLRPSRHMDRSIQDGEAVDGTRTNSASIGVAGGGLECLSTSDGGAHRGCGLRRWVLGSWPLAPTGPARALTRKPSAGTVQIRRSDSAGWFSFLCLFLFFYIERAHLVTPTGPTYMRGRSPRFTKQCMRCPIDNLTEHVTPLSAPSSTRSEGRGARTSRLTPVRCPRRGRRAGRPRARRAPPLAPSPPPRRPSSSPPSFSRRRRLRRSACPPGRTRRACTRRPRRAPRCRSRQRRASGRR